MQTWAEQRPRFYIRAGAQFENPFGVPHDEVALQIAEESPNYVAQVIFGLLVPDDGQVFTAETVRWLWDGQPIAGSYWCDEEAVEAARGARERWGRLNGRFVGGCDLARKKDATVIFVADTAGVPDAPARIVYYRRLVRVPWPVVYREIARASCLFSANILCDSTGIGDVVVDAVEGMTWCPRHEDLFEPGAVCQRQRPGDDCQKLWDTISADGFVFSTPSKVKLITHLAQVLGDGFDPHRAEDPCGLLRCPPLPKLREQLGVYTFDDRELETDELMALSLVAWNGLHDLPGRALVGSVYGGPD